MALRVGFGMGLFALVLASSLAEAKSRQKQARQASAKSSRSAEAKKSNLQDKDFFKPKKTKIPKKIPEVPFADFDLDKLD